MSQSNGQQWSAKKKWTVFGFAVLVITAIVLALNWQNGGSLPFSSEKKLSIVAPGGQGTKQVKVIDTAVGQINVPTVGQCHFDANDVTDNSHNFGPAQQDFPNATAALQEYADHMGRDCAFAAQAKLTRDRGLGNYTPADVTALATQYQNNPGQWQTDVTNFFMKPDGTPNLNAQLADETGVPYYTTGFIPGANGGMPTLTAISQQQDMGQALVLTNADGSGWKGNNIRVKCKDQPGAPTPIASVPQASPPPPASPPPSGGCDQGCVVPPTCDNGGIPVEQCQGPPPPPPPTCDNGGLPADQCTPAPPPTCDNGGIPASQCQPPPPPPSCDNGGIPASQCQPPQSCPPSMPYGTYPVCKSGPEKGPEPNIPPGVPYSPLPADPAQRQPTQPATPPQVYSPPAAPPVQPAPGITPLPGGSRVTVPAPAPNAPSAASPGGAKTTCIVAPGKTSC